MFDYFYGAQAEQFAFYRVPKVLFTNDRFKYLSAEAKTLYGILLDRVPLSAKNGWVDEQGRVYIICTIEEIMADMNCGNKKAMRIRTQYEEYFRESIELDYLFRDRTLDQDGLSYREIARLIGRNVSTVSREIRRNCTHMYDIPAYYPHTAQRKYLLRRKGKSKACFATLAERKTHFYIAIKIPDRKAETMENALVSVLSAFPPQLVKTITCDRGTEFANWRRIEERLHCDVYFADPYCAWQKGTNDNLNGLLREFYPKGRNLSRVAPAPLKRNLALINARPRKVLNFHSAQELWDFELNSCCT